MLVAIIHAGDVAGTTSFAMGVGRRQLKHTASMPVKKANYCLANNEAFVGGDQHSCW